MIALICPGCGRKLSIKADIAGKTGVCPHCKKRIHVPAPEATQGAAHRDQTDEVTLAPSASLPSPQPSGDERLAFLAPPQGPGELGRLGSYRVLKVLGAGGMGLVLQAEDPVLKRSVALKVMQPELAAQPDARQRFLREAQATAAIEHPHVVTIHQVAEDRGVPFLAMPFLKGEPLDQRLQREKRLPVAEVLHLGRQIAEGLAAAHQTGLIHRDIKPANLWLEPHEQRGKPGDCWVKILDFGLARAVKNDDAQLTKSGAILGTPAYMAPEQARGEKVDARCDLFSLGGVLYRMLTGKQPFAGADPISLLVALATEEPRPVRDLRPDAPPALADLVHQLLAKDPAQRPASAHAVADALAALEEEKTQVAQRASSPQRKGAFRLPPKNAPPRRLLPAAGGAVLLLLLLVGVLFLARPSRDGKSSLEPPYVPPNSDKVVTNSIGMKLMPIEPGAFWIGSPRAEPGRYDDEYQHEVELARPFLMGVCKVTVGQFAAFVKDSGYQTDAERAGAGSSRLVGGKWELDARTTWRNPGFDQTDDHPVVCATWNDATAFCKWLSKKEGKRYALPSEAQWEWCCRAGTRGMFSFGDDPAALSIYAWHRDNAQERTHPVGKKKPNAWGLYDMHGNVWEWCNDWYAADAYRTSLRKNPPGPAAGTQRVTRGGSWWQGPSACRAANRGHSPPDLRNSNVGFRVVILPDETLTNSIGMKLKLIGTGKFTMGSPPNEPGRGKDEDAHEVAITRPFYLGVNLVTVGQFAAFVKDADYLTDAEKSGKGAARRLGNAKWKSDPSTIWRTPGFAQSDDHPVVCVSWNDAKAFCKWLSKKEGKHYTLPTEAQWEYSCRAGSSTRYFFGTDPKKLGEYAWYGENSGMRTHRVGQKKPNAWGLFDMYGNAQEATGDWYATDYYKKSPKEDPPGPPEGEKIVTRGNGWAFSAGDVASARRFSYARPGGRDTHTGFRVLLLWY